MTITIQDASAFTVACRKHGLTKKGVGLMALQNLLQLREAPSPSRPLNHNARAPFCSLRYIGPLIANGLAAFDKAAQHYCITEPGLDWLERARRATSPKMAAYCITEAGLDWLERLEAVGIISPH